ncbi:MAG: helix-turn-helix domain-containing protein [Clostridia bacterium]
MQEYDYTAVGMRIKSARKAKNFTQEYVAEQIDVGCQHISDIERGACGLSISSLIDLCRVLEIDADYILFGRAAGNGLPINGILQKMTEEQRMYAEEFVRLYAKSCGIE